MKRKQGFTLVELLFVMSIIGMILALLAPALIIVKKRALAIRCASQQRSIFLAIQAYSDPGDPLIPYIVTGPEARTHPKRWFQPSTGVPSLHHFLETIAVTGDDARCPADNGSAGQSFYPTKPGLSCFEDWGQSMLYNSSCYSEIGAPGYVSDQSGPLHGANPVSFNSVDKIGPERYLLTSDFWAHWHFGATSAANKRPYYTNILFLDGHVAGRRFASEEEALAYLSWDGVRRWWISHPKSFEYSR